MFIFLTSYKVFLRIFHIKTLQKINISLFRFTFILKRFNSNLINLRHRVNKHESIRFTYNNNKPRTVFLNQSHFPSRVLTAQLY